MTALRNAPQAGVLAAIFAVSITGAPAGAQTPRPFSLTLYDQPDYRGGSVTFYGDNANIGSTGFADRARSAQIRGTWRLCEGGGFRNRCEVLSSNIRDLGPYGFSGQVGSAQLVETQAAVPAPRYTPPYPDVYAQAQPAPAYAAPYVQPLPDFTPPAVDAPPPATAYPPGPYAQPPYAQAPYTPAPYVQPPYGAPGPAAAPAPAFGAADGRTAVFFAQPSMRGADVSAWTARAADGFCTTQGLGPAIYFDQSQRAPRAVDPEGRAVGEGPVLRDVLCRRY